MPSSSNMLQRRFMRLVVVAPSNGKDYWLCVCDCGEPRRVLGSSLRAGRTRSCGCLSRDLARARGKHGASRTNLYKRWQGMIRRCEVPTHHKYYLYGARGIRVCDRWHNYELFVSDMGSPPPGSSIDRIDGNGNYEPGNCRWASPKEQQDHVSGALRITLDGETHCVAEWARRFGMHPNTLRGRIKRGMSLIEARATIARETSGA